MRMKNQLWTGCFVTLLAAGCLQNPASDSRSSEPANGEYPRGTHPYPIGNEWPPDLGGPFQRKAILRASVETGGVVLDGSIWLPDVTPGTKLPVVLWSSPYFSQTSVAHDDPAIADNSDYSESVPVNLLVEQGYAVALFSVRGTGYSGGCWEFFGPNEQHDQAALVDWLASQSWSNGRVGMMGLSYHGTTPWEAAIQNPPALKTIVVAGMVSDAYTFFHTPQGAGRSSNAVFPEVFAAVAVVPPPAAIVSEREPGPSSIERMAARLCPEVVEMARGFATGTFADERPGKFWSDRNLILRFPEISTSVLLTHGFHDGAGHVQQEDWAWESLYKAPKRMLEGQWGHQFPNYNAINPDWALPSWNQTLVEWLDFWLKGIGDGPPRLASVDYQDGEGLWHASTAWPPSEARSEVLYLADGAASAAPTTKGVSFESRPSDPASHLCPAPTPSVNTAGLVFLTAPVSERTVIAGNPVAWLPMTSDLDGGLVGVHFYKLGREFSCGVNGATGATLITPGTASGAANLRFHEGGYVPKAFPVGVRVGVRVDLANMAQVFEAGERLAVVVSHGSDGSAFSHTGGPYFPRIWLARGAEAEAPSIIVPVVEGTFEGAPPTFEYGVRPFLPPGIG